ncbi:MAG: CBS domain-containing protein [Syntrophotaleaceae bacterium]
MRRYLGCGLLPQAGVTVGLVLMAGTGGDPQIYQLLLNAVLGALIRHLFAHGFEPAEHSRHLIPMVTSQTAKDIMGRQLIYAVKEDKVETVVRRMIKAGVKEIAVLDQERRLIGDLTMLDLQHYHLGLA